MATKRAMIYTDDKGRAMVREYVGRGMVRIPVDMLLGMARAAGVRSATVQNALENHLVRYQLMQMQDRGEL